MKSFKIVEINIFDKNLTKSQIDVVKEGKEWIFCGVFVIFGSVTAILYGLFLSIDLKFMGPGITLHSYSYPVLIIGIVSFLYGIKKFASIRKHILKKRNIIIFYSSCFGFLVSVPFIIYGYSNSIWCSSDYQGVECYLRYSVISNAYIYSGLSLFIINLLIILYSIFQYKPSKIENYDLEITKKTIQSQDNILYKVRKEQDESGEIGYICGMCGEKNRLRLINKRLGLYKCESCESENYMD